MTTSPRRTLPVLALLATVATLAGSPGAQAAAGSYRQDDYAEALNIVPPGSDGSITLVEAVQAGPDRVAVDGTDAPPNFANQLEMYDALGRVDPAALTAADLARYFKDASFGVRPEDVVSTTSPKPGVTILRDTFGVPHVYGDTFADVAWGAGWAGTQDRMFLQDTLRHVGAARLTEFLGPSEGNKAMDRAQVRAAGYDDAEATAQIDQLSDRFGAEGEKFEQGVAAFAAGINAAQREMCPQLVPFGPQCPPEYAALQILPADWSRKDITYIASLVGGIFGRGGGSEVANALWLTALQRKFGDAAGRQVFEDLRERNDPEAPTTIGTRFPYNEPPPRPDADAIAMPDPGAPVAPGSGDATSTPSLPVLPELPASVDGPFGPIDLFGTAGMSNALVVGAAESATGRPLAVFGPQTGYTTPQLLVEIDLHGPGYDVRGVSFAGTQAIVQLGRGRDYAWSATSAGGDNVDQVLEELCNADGSPPTINSTSYRYQGSCVPLLVRTHRQIVKPTAGGIGTPEVYDLTVMRSVHGPVLYRTLAEGRPAAVVEQRSTFLGEIDSGIGFMRVNDPDFVHDAASFQQAFSAVDYTFNWFFVDDRDIAYFESGKLPVRDRRVDPDLPRWGTGEWDWKGWLSYDAHPKAINPPSGYFANWNNKPAPGFSANDGEYGYGSVYRSLTLQRRIEGLIAGGGTATREELVGAMIDGAFVDARADNLATLALDVVGDDPSLASAAALLRAWVAAGALREDRDRDGAYSHQAAIALWDTWYPKLAKAVLSDTLGSLVDALPAGLDDHPSQHTGSAWNGVAWYGYVHKDLRQALGRPVDGPYSRTYCGAGVLAVCTATLRASLATAVSDALAAQGVTTVGALTYDKSIDEIRHEPVVGLVGVRPIDWQNRPTFQQVVEVTGHRPRTAGSVPPLGLGVMAAFGRRRRRR